jgi:hypothetical protein
LEEGDQRLPFALRASEYGPEDLYKKLKSEFMYNVPYIPMIPEVSKSGLSAAEKKFFII